MKVILTEKVEKLGEAGDVKEVANGYARNFLLPRALAIPATGGALRSIEHHKASTARKQEAEISASRDQANRLQGLTVLLYARTGEQNRLYGSITPNDVAEALRVQHKFEIDRRRIKIDQAIHRTGSYTATVNLGRNLSAQVNLLVEAESRRTTGALTSVAAEAPVIEQPAAEAPVAEAPVAEAPAAETEAVEAPVAEAATAETEIAPVASVEAEAPASEPEAAQPEAATEAQPEEAAPATESDEQA